MKTAVWIFAGVLGACVLGFVASAGAAGTGRTHGAIAGEKDIDFNDAPKIVQDAVIKATNGAKVHHVVQYEIHGTNHFHVIVGNANLRQTLVVDEAGHIMLTKDLVDFDTLPGQVKDTIGREAGSGRIADAVEKVSNQGKTYFLATVIEKDGNDKVIRVGEDGKLITEVYEEDVQLAGERAVPQSARIIRTDIKTETVKFDNLPGQVKTTIGALAKSDPIESVVKLYPGDKFADAYVAIVGKDPATQRKLFVDDKGDLLEGSELDPYIVTEHHHHGG